MSRSKPCPECAGRMNVVSQRKNIGDHWVTLRNWVCLRCWRVEPAQDDD